MKNDKAIWYYLEQSYDLTVNDFIKGFPNVMNVLKKEETFINHTTNEQKQFLDTVLNSTLCKIIGAGNTPSSWNWIMLLVQLSLDSKINSSNRATWIGMKMVKLSIRMISQPKKQNEALKLFRQYFDILFGDYMLEVNRHYLFNYFYYRGDFKDMFQSNQEDKSEKQEIENNSKELPKIEWQGTQKELAELFVELHKNGWITTIPTKLIKRYFTNSNSIEQVLKPTHDSRTKVKTYEGIYTSKYSPRFDEIRQKS